MMTHSATAASPVIEARGLTKVFRDFWGRPRLTALRGLDLRVERGETFGLLGPNGSGKTTTLKCLMGLLWPTAGDVQVLGKPPSDVAVKARIGFLPEETYLYRFLTAAETLDFYLRLFKVPRRERRRRTEELLERVGLASAARRRVGEFSKGMARRVALAGALAGNPELLILDEPTSGLDPLGTRQMKDLIKQAAEAGTTVLVSSHILADVQETCDRVVILKAGVVALAGRVNELLEAREVMHVEIDSLVQGSPAMAQLLAAIEATGSHVRGVEHPRYTLEQLFLEVIEGRERTHAPAAAPVASPTEPAGS